MAEGAGPVDLAHAEAEVVVGEAVVIVDVGVEDAVAELIEDFEEVPIEGGVAIVEAETEPGLIEDTEDSFEVGDAVADLVGPGGGDDLEDEGEALFFDEEAVLGECGHGGAEPELAVGVTAEVHDEIADADACADVEDLVEDGGGAGGVAMGELVVAVEGAMVTEEDVVFGGESSELGAGLAVWGIADLFGPYFDEVEAELMTSAAEELVERFPLEVTRADSSDETFDHVRTFRA